MPDDPNKIDETQKSITQPNEIELGLDVKRSSIPAPENASIPGASTDKAQANIASLGADMNTDELLQAIANSPTELLIPWEEVQLPSRGLFYEGWTNGTVKVRAMTQSDEKVFANRRLIQSGQALDRLFSGCVEFPTDIDPADLLVGDRTFLLYYIRGITFGNLYEFAMTCPNESCKAQTTHSYDMNQLYETVIYAQENLGVEPFRVSLPQLSKVTNRDLWVGLRFLRQRDISDLVSRQRFNKRASNTVRAGNVRRGGKRGDQPPAVNQAEAILESSLVKSIMCFNDNSDPGLVKNLIGKLHAADHAAIRDFLMLNSPGIDTTVIINCQECSNEVTIELPITDGFFRTPKSQSA